MIRELDDLVVTCEKTMHGAKDREGDFRSILTRVEQVNEAATKEMMLMDLEEIDGNNILGYILGVENGN